MQKERESIPKSIHTSFVVSRNIKFQDKDVDTYFVHVYASLSLEQSADYEVVKAAILRAFEMVPEPYNLRFRNLCRNDQQSFVEFAQEKQVLFNRWCAV